MSRGRPTCYRPVGYTSAMHGTFRRVGIATAVACSAWSASSIRRPLPVMPMPPAQPAHAQASGGATRNGRLGLVHVDNMDLHVRRRSDTPPVAVEQLPATDIADRYERAAATGAAWHRWSLYWDLIDRGGTFDWAAADAIVARDVASGLFTLGVVQGARPALRTRRARRPDIEQPVPGARTAPGPTIRRRRPR